MKTKVNLSTRGNWQYTCTVCGHAYEEYELGRKTSYTEVIARAERHLNNWHKGEN